MNALISELQGLTYAWLREMCGEFTPWEECSELWVDKIHDYVHVDD